MVRWNFLENMYIKTILFWGFEATLLIRFFSELLSTDAEKKALW